jgi:hypothetical protein
LVKHEKKKVYESNGIEGPSERTIWQYMQFANDIPENVKAVFKSVTGNSFGCKHAIQLLRLKGDPDFMLEVAKKLLLRNYFLRTLILAISESATENTFQNLVNISAMVRAAG